MEKKYESILPFVDRYKEEIAAVEVRRDLWKQKAKSVLQKERNDFINEFELPCYVENDESLLNQEVIFLAFVDPNTGIVLKPNNQMMIRSGGGLIYHQNTNGKISASIVLPYIEDIKGCSRTQKEIETIKPENLDEEHIISQIEKFFKEILEWECFLRHSIGFNH